MKSTDRFEILERLGSGGMGVVYRAFDRRRSEEVALKTLVNAGPQAIFRFKSEFRSLVDVVHPNLVALYELSALDETWILTMELVRGVHFLEHVRGSGRRASVYADTAYLADAARVDTDEEPTVEAAPTDEGRLRTALLQLARGIQALHDAGKLHCDIKPSNVLVSYTGRVVILDFGLVTELAPSPFSARRPHEIAGTIAYMAPEQIQSSALTPAVDWYAFGVLLYEALTGTLPFTGSLLEILSDKQLHAPMPPRLLAPSAPEDLSALALRLLQPWPMDRPQPKEIFDWLDRGAEAEVSSRASLFTGSAGVFVGRVAELATLSRMFEARARGRAVTVLLSGTSGIGKSALARRFLEEQQARGPLVVLEGRCYERESVPYKAFDSVIDRLTEHLLRLRHAEAAALMPPDIELLAQIFPVLHRVAAAGSAIPATASDPQEIRRRAFASLRELLRKLAQQTPLALLIDDLQWGDADSAALLLDLLSPPAPPPLFLVACFRGDDVASSPLLRPLLQRWSMPSEGHDVHRLSLSPLDPADCRALAEALLAEEAPASTLRGTSSSSSAPSSSLRQLSGVPEPTLLDMITREASGSPLFAQELVRHARQRGARAAPGSSGVIRLEDVVRARVGSLNSEERELLEVVAIAGHPVPESVALAASGISQGQRALTKLRAHYLLRGRSSELEDLVEPYHDRIRETVIATLPTEVQQWHHRTLAEALRAQPDPDPEILVEHYQAAGAPADAARFAVLAAERAEAALAFSRAASLYRVAIDAALPTEPVWRLREKLALALANAGRGREAAVSFQEAAAELERWSPGDMLVLDFKRRAGEQYLRSGHIDEGLARMREVLGAVGARFPATPGAALGVMVAERALLHLRGFDFTLRPAARLAVRDRIKLEAYWATSAGLAMVDAVRGAYFQTRHARTALDLGEPINVARCLSAEVAVVGSVGGAANRRRCAEVRAIAEGLAARVDDPGVLLLTRFCAAMAAYCGGEWATARARCAEARQIGRERCVGVTWEMNSIDLIEFWSLAYLGELLELGRRLPLLLREARERDDVFAETNLRLGMPNLAWLAQDRADEAEAQVEAAMGRWTSRGVHSQHYFELVARTQIVLYRGEGQEAYRRVEATWPKLEGALLLRLQAIRIDLYYLRARAALSASAAPLAPFAGGPSRARLLARAEQDARRIAAEDMAWAAPLSQQINGCVAAARGFVGTAIASLDEAARGFDRLDMALHAAATRFVRGELRGEAGRDEREEARAWMARHGVVRPERMAAVLLPIQTG